MTKQQKERVQILAVSVDSHEESKKLAQMLGKRFEGEFDFTQGVVRWQFIEVDYKKRASNEQIRRELAKIK